MMTLVEVHASRTAPDKCNAIVRTVNVTHGFKRLPPLHAI
jgi:hypothetical protein